MKRKCGQRSTQNDGHHRISFPIGTLRQQSQELPALRGALLRLYGARRKVSLSVALPTRPVFVPPPSARAALQRPNAQASRSARLGRNTLRRLVLGCANPHKCRCCLTRRSNGPSTAGGLGPVRGTLYIFAARAKAPCRCGRLSSNVRHHGNHFAVLHESQRLAA